MQPVDAEGARKDHVKGKDASRGSRPVLLSVPGIFADTVREFHNPAAECVMKISQNRCYQNRLIKFVMDFLKRY